MTNLAGDEVVTALIVEVEKDLLTVIGYLITHSTKKTRKNLESLTELGLNANFVSGLVQEGQAEFEKRIHQHPISN